MNRTLRRPMFRIGGVAEGITSGLQPRQGYATNKENLVKENDYSKMKINDLGNMNIGQLRELSKSMSYKPKSDPWDYLGEVALNLVSTPTSGDLIGDIGTSMREPYSRYLDRKSTAAEQEYGSEADMFKTMIGAQADVLSAEKEGKGWLKQWEFEQIPILNRTIRDLTEKQDKGIITREEELELKNAIDQRSGIVDLDEVTKGFLNSEEGGELVVDEMAILLEKDLQIEDPTKRKYPKGKKDVQLYLDAIAEVKRRLSLKEGGRVGYQSGNMVQPNAMQAAMPMDQESEAPPEVQNIDYETLRARLPATITDDIVRLIANSTEAMEDFATIQTQQDINNFNEKYGVELVLPAEA